MLIAVSEEGREMRVVSGHEWCQGGVAADNYMTFGSSDIWALSSLPTLSVFVKTLYILLKKVIYSRNNRDPVWPTET